MRRYLRARYFPAALIAVVMIIYGAYTSVQNTKTNVDEFARVQNSRIILSDLESLEGELHQLETGYEGFLVTGRKELLAPYETACERADAEFKHLQGLTKDTLEQQFRTAKLRKIAEAMKAEADRIIETHREDPPAAAAMVAKGEGLRLMAEAEALLKEMRDAEVGILTDRQMKLVANLKETNTIVVSTGVVAIIAGIVGAVLLLLYLMGKERQERLFFEKEKAVQADRAKTEFLATMSHEIRTPMNAILGFGELLHELADRPQQKHYAKAIMNSGNALLTLINDMLDLSKIEARKMELHPEPVEMKRFVENLETLFSFRAGEKALDYRVIVDPSVPPALSFDALRVRQVLVNLIGNALKFTRSGHVHVAIRCEPGDKPEEMQLCLEVEDTGIGIPGDQLPHIFRPFYQVQAEQARHFQGTGLGLGISERLVKLMGGTIEVRSEVGKGSTFRIAIPVCQQAGGMPEGEGAASGGAVDFNRLAPSRILLVDDVPLNRELIRSYLQGTHHQVTEAENGEQAVIVCERQLPDLVLMDIRMPLTDGRSALGMLKSQDTTCGIPIIALTASTLLNGQEELKSLFDGFANKPVSRERLYLELAKFLPVRATAATGKPQPEVPPAEIAHAREWPELQRELALLRDKVLPGLVELVPAQATLRFAADLQARAEKHECLPLADYAVQLDSAASRMDFAEAGRLLAAFPGVVDQLSHDPV